MKILGLLFLILLPFAFLAQNIFHDADHVGGKLNDGSCFTEKEFIDIQENYGVYYSDMFEMGFRLCHEDEIRYALNNLVDDLLETLDSNSATELDSLFDLNENSLIPLKKLIEHYNYLREQDLELIIGKEKIDELIETIFIASSRFSDNHPDSEAARSGIDLMSFPNTLNRKLTSSTQSFGLNSVFSASPSFIIDATAQFLVSKTKQELNTRFVQEMRKVYMNNFEFSEMFQSTNNVILHSDPLSFSTWSSQLQLAIKRDVSDLPYTMPAYIKRDEKIYKNLKTNQKEILEASFIFLQATQNNRNGIHPIASITELEKNFGVNTEQKLAINQSLSMISSIIESVAEGEKLVDSKKILSLGQDEKKLFLYRFFYTKKYEKTLRSIFPQEGLSMYDFLNDDSQLIIAKNFLSIAASTSTTIESINQSISLMKSSNSAENSREGIIQLNNAIPQLFENGFRAIYITQEETMYQTDNWYKRFRPVVNEVVALNNNILVENYQSALLSATNILVLSLNDILEKVDEKNADNVEVVRERIKKMVYWAGFMSDFVSIDGAQSVGDLLQKYVEPSASYRTKRNNNYTISLNAYPGGYYGNEQLAFNDNFKQYNSSFSLSAPVGVSVMAAFRKNGTKENFSYVKDNKYVAYSGFVHGVFIPALDFGAPFAYRWSSDETDGFSEELKWSQLFAPGAYYSLGMPKSGITFAIGGQMTPQLRSISEDGITLQKSAFRLGLILTYDIPVFTLWKSKVKK